MLPIFMFVLPSPSPHLPIPMVVDEDINLEFSDEELESIAGMPISYGYAESYDSDVIVGGRRIISLNSVLAFENNHQGLINYIKERFSASGIRISPLAAGVLSDNLRAEAPRVIKRAHRGFRLDLNTGRLVYIH